MLWNIYIICVSFYFLQNANPRHTANAKNYIENKNKVSWRDGPAPQSPDLNIMESVRDYIKRHCT